MIYSLCKFNTNDDYFDVIEIISGFDDMWNLMDKLDILQDNLSNGNYVITGYDVKSTEVELEFVFVVEDDCIKVFNPEEYFNYLID